MAAKYFVDMLANQSLMFYALYGSKLSIVALKHKFHMTVCCIWPDWTTQSKTCHMLYIAYLRHKWVRLYTAIVYTDHCS